MAKAFASQGDLTQKTISFTEVGKGLWAFTAEGDPNSGVGQGSRAICFARRTLEITDRLGCEQRMFNFKTIS